MRNQKTSWTNLQKLRPASKKPELLLRALPNAIWSLNAPQETYVKQHNSNMP